MRIGNWRLPKVAICLLVCAVVVGAASLDFSNLMAGTIVSELKAGSGITGDLKGTVGVFGYNPSFGANTNAAIVFDSSNPTGGDDDLGTPNEAYGGPGVGDAGATNKVGLGNLLIVAEDLVDANNDGYVDDPDDADLEGAYLEFDFSKVKGGGTVTINSVTVMDIEGDEAGNFIELSGPKLPLNLIVIPPTGDNGVRTIDNIGLEGVDLMRINLDGSGAVASVVAEQELKRSCWFTFGGFQNASIKSGSKDFTFGGNVGPPPSSSIEVNDHNSGDTFHMFDGVVTKCEVIDKTGPDQPGGKKGFEINKAYFEGTGRFVDKSEGKTYYDFPCSGFVIDAGEPAGKKGNDKDRFEITVWDPDTNQVVFEAKGDLDGGNVQIHPPVGN